MLISFPFGYNKQYREEVKFLTYPVSHQTLSHSVDTGELYAVTLIMVNCPKGVTQFWQSLREHKMPSSACWVPNSLLFITTLKMFLGHHVPLLFTPGISHFPDDTGPWCTHCYENYHCFLNPLDQEKLNNAKWNSLETLENGAGDSNGFNVSFCRTLTWLKRKYWLCSQAKRRQKNRGRISHLMRWNNIQW